MFGGRKLKGGLTLFSLQRDQHDTKMETECQLPLPEASQ